jgi:2'-5' RNA ligase
MTAAPAGEGNADPGDPPLRLFFALQPDAGARRSLAALARDVANATGGRAPRAENLHLTLAFLGDVARARLVAVEAIGATAAPAVEPFLLTLDRVGCFRNAGVAWAGAAVVPPALQRLFDVLRDALGAARLPVERRDFHAHVTLARRCTRALPDAPIASIAWRADALALMASETQPGGPRYRQLAAWPLPETMP